MVLLRRFLNIKRRAGRDAVRFPTATGLKEEAEATVADYYLLRQQVKALYVATPAAGGEKASTLPRDQASFRDVLRWPHGSGQYQG